jgi:putative ABC transport system ATP-binding protein
MGPPEVRALWEVNAAIGEGDYVAIMGPSGSGKSTFVNILGLLDTPTSGAVRIRGRDTSGLRERERSAPRAYTFGFVFQDYHIMPDRTAEENVALGLAYLGVPRRLRADRAAVALERVGLVGRKDALAGTLSGGERQRVAVARAIVHEPALLLADEPTGNLDLGSTEQILDILDVLNSQGSAVVMVTHDPAAAGRARRVTTTTDGCVDRHLYSPLATPGLKRL